MAAKASGANTDDEKLGDMEGLRSSIVTILSNTKVSELQLLPEAVILKAATEPKLAIEILVRNKKRAAPVMGDDNSFLGVLDLKDTLRFALESYDAVYGGGASQAVNKKPKPANASTNPAMQYLFGSQSSMSRHTLSSLCARNPFRTVSKTDNLLALAEIFALGSHVVGIMDNHKLAAVITQGQFFQQIAKQWVTDMGKQGKCSLQKLWDLNYIVRPPKTVQTNLKAVQAFRVMNECGLSGLAVVDELGTLRHNTSATDIKLWLLDGNHSLDLSIEQFLVHIRQLSIKETYPFTVCSLQDTVERAIKKLQATKYHRLWIVDEETKPIGVFALTDIFKFILAQKEEKQAQLDKLDQNQKEKKKETVDSANGDVNNNNND